MELDRRPGTYVLLYRSRKSSRVQVGQLGPLLVRTGWYAYVGSAFGPGGLYARVSRHVRGAETLRWHVDYLRRVVTPKAAWFAPGPNRLEHLWARALERAPSSEIPIGHFGSSDCGCHSHLFFFHRRPNPELLGPRVCELSVGAGGRLATLPRPSERVYPDDLNTTGNGA